MANVLAVDTIQLREKMSANSGNAQFGEVDDKPATHLLDLSDCVTLSVFQALNLRSLLTLAQTSKALNEATQNELLWMERCQSWGAAVDLNAWRARVDSGKALFRLLRSFSRFVGAWVHADVSSDPEGTLMYITPGPEGLEGWHVVQDWWSDDGRLKFIKAFDVRGRPDGSHRLDFISTNVEVSISGLGAKAVHLGGLAVQSDDDELFLGAEGETRMQSEGTEAALRRRLKVGALYKRLKVEVPTAGKELAGLWTGSYQYGDWEILNLTYQTDNLLVATKVTGDPYVPSGEISFKANMNTDAEDRCLLSHYGAYQTRFLGQGRLAFRGFKEARWVDGFLQMSRRNRNRLLRFEWKAHSSCDCARITLEEAFARWSAAGRP